MAHDLCYSTLVMNSLYMGIPNVEYETHAISDTKNAVFVKRMPSILGMLIAEILSARKQAKKDMAAAPTDELIQLFNGKQMALKVSANSIYGFTGAVARGMYPCVEIAESVTCCGRAMIEKTKNLVEDFMPGSKVVYGVLREGDRRTMSLAADHC